jgi:hypothetical protein
VILYSIVPPEVVFNGFEDDGGIKYIEGEYRGEKVLVARMTDGSYTVSRLLSTKPSLFLDPAFQPGAAVDEREFK